jgi:3-isopropylmalate/(R)-2-methylmalate dehydratase small subunit
MQKFTILQGLVAPMDRENVDTDAIIPKQFLKSINKTGFGPNLFDEWRYLDPGEPGRTRIGTQAQPRLRAKPAALRKGASILLARKNFGCGSAANTRPGRWSNTAFARSSRPATPTSFSTTASRTVCCPSCCPNPVVNQLFDEVHAFPGYQLTIDLERQVIVRPQGEEIRSTCSHSASYCLLNGFDDIGLTLRHRDKIAAFEAHRLATKPWLAHTMVGA